MPPVVVVPLGEAYLEHPDWGTLLPALERAVGSYGQDVKDLRRWGTALQGLDPEGLRTQGLTLPSMEFALPEIRRRRGGTLRVLLVTTDQTPPHPQDTVTLGPVVETFLPLLVPDVDSVKCFPIVGCNPARLHDLWGPAGEAIDHAVAWAEPGGTVDLLHVGGAPELRSALSFRLNLGWAAGLDTRTWLVPPVDTYAGLEKDHLEVEQSFDVLNAQQVHQHLQGLHFDVAADLLGLVGAAWTEQPRLLCQAGAAVLAIDFQQAAELLSGLEPDDDVREIRSDLDALLVSSEGSRFPSSMAVVVEALITIGSHRLSTGDVAGALGVVHLISELLPLIAWEAELGGACSPQALARRAQSNGSHYGDFDPGQCPVRHHTKLRKAIRRGDGKVVVPQYGTVGRQLAECTFIRSAPAEIEIKPCQTPCSFQVTQPAVVERYRHALGFQDSEIVKLRHSTPAGHFLTVPDHDDLVAKWNEAPKHWDPTAWPHVGSAMEIPAALRSVLERIAGAPTQPSKLIERIKFAALTRLR